MQFSQMFKRESRGRYLNLFLVMALIITNSSLWLTLSPISRILSDEIFKNEPYVTHDGVQ
jgi:hypothetical protein